MRIGLGTAISIIGNGWQFITDTCVQIYALQDDHAVTGGEEEELQLKWVQDEKTNGGVYVAVCVVVVYC